MAALLIVFIGAGIGGALRHLVNVLTMRLGYPTYAGTLFINATGSLLIGVVLSYFALKGHLSPRLQLFLTTGILGGYTTFSAFSLETVLLIERGRYDTAISNAIVSVMLSVAATFGGIALCRVLLRP